MATTTQHCDVRQIASGHLEALHLLLGRVDMDAVERFVDRLRQARDAGATVFVAGNGGSAATAAHLANDLGKATKRSGCPAMRVLCLSDNAPWLTALANDEGYDRVFAGQLENFAGPDDVLLLLSASGNSRNLVLAAEVAASRGATTVAMLGFGGGTLKAVAADCLWLPTPEGQYELVEDAHAVLCHVITRCLGQDRPA